MTDLGLAHLTALDLAPVALVAEAARAGFSFIGLRAIPATAGGPAYPTRMGTDAHRELKRSLAGEGVRLNEIKPGDLISIPAHYLRAAQICDVVADMPASDAAIIAEAREGRLPPGEGALPLGELLEALPVDASLSVEMPLPALAVRPRLATALNATRRLLEHRVRGASRPDHRREAGGPIQIRTT